MTFLCRSVKESDVDFLYRLAQQVSMIRLPRGKRELIKIIQKSIESFSADIPPEDGVYVFVLENTLNREVIGTIRIDADFGSKEHPYYFFDVIEKEHTDEKLGIIIKHKALKLCASRNVSMLNTVVLDDRFRNRPDKLGKLLVFLSFVYMGLHPGKFRNQIQVSLEAPATDEGINPFWNTLGKQFTGMDMKDTYKLFKQNKRDFIWNLFPKEDIYICLLSQENHPSPVRVRNLAMKHISDSIGFQYLNRADVFGGPIFESYQKDISVIKKGTVYKVDHTESEPSQGTALMGFMKDGCFRGGYFPFRSVSQTAFLSGSTKKLLGLNNEDNIYLCPIDYTKYRGQTCKN
ncbi:arginine N-succinyltransferase [Desulfococcaceae bacterium HSG7]|nr:arginine N-succinyltransferase [Desulfococcaceae bacterium HSG7]